MLVGSGQSYCSSKQAYFLAYTVEVVKIEC